MTAPNASDLLSARAGGKDFVDGAVAVRAAMETAARGSTEEGASRRSSDLTIEILLAIADESVSLLPVASLEVFILAKYDAEV